MRASPGLRALGQCPGDPDSPPEARALQRDGGQHLKIHVPLPMETRNTLPPIFKSLRVTPVSLLPLPSGSHPGPSLIRFPGAWQVGLSFTPPSWGPGWGQERVFQTPKQAALLHQPSRSPRCLVGPRAASWHPRPRCPRAEGESGPLHRGPHGSSPAGLGLPACKGTRPGAQPCLGPRPGSRWPPRRQLFSKADTAGQGHPAAQPTPGL